MVQFIFTFKYWCIWRRQWHPTPVLLPGKSHGQRSLVGCSPWGRWELDTTERLHFTSLYDDLGELKYKEKKWSFEFWSGLKRLKVKVAQLCPTLCHPMDYTVHGVLQARILEWITLPFSRGSFQPRDWTSVSYVSCISRWVLYHLGFPDSSVGKESICNAGDLGSILGLGRSPGEGNGYPLQYSGLENSMENSMRSQRVGHDWATFTFTC